MNPILQAGIDRVAARLPVAGAAFGIVQNGVVTLKETYGYADLEKKIPVTPETVFTVASESKAFTCTLFSILCEKGLLDWDKPVRTWWKDFFFTDDYVSAHITPRDMASHRSGLTSHGMLRRQTDIHSLKEMAYRAQYLAPCSGFRDTFHYQNELYAVLGYLCELVTGKSYEALVREYIGAPLGMNLLFRSEEMPADRLFAEPYGYAHGALYRALQDHCAYNNPCGGIRADLNDMLKWLACLSMDTMTPSGTTLLSEKSFRNLYRPNSFWTFGGTRDRMRSYGLGLAPSVYRGEQLVYHGGSLAGYKINLGFFPEHHCGYFIATNADTTPLLYTLKNILADMALGRMDDSYDAFIDNQIQKFLAPSESKPEPAHIPLTDAQKKAFTGTYTNKAYGTSVLTENDDGGIAVTCGIDIADIYQTAENEFHGRFRACKIQADCFFEPDGSRVRMSFCDTFSPDEFVKIK